MSGIFETANLKVRMSDVQYGTHRRPSGKRSRGANVIPDLVTVEDSSHQIRLMGEIKTFWTFKRQEKQTQKIFLAQKFGNWLPS